MEEEIALAKEIIKTGYNNLSYVLEKETIQLNLKNWTVCKDANNCIVFLNVSTGDLLLNGPKKVF